MSYTANVTTGTGTATVTVSTGGRGPAGATGPAGAAGTSLTAGTGIDITEGVVSSTVTGNATHTGDATGSTALTLATVNGNIGSFTNASLTVNAKGLVTAASSGTAPITSVTGTANQITVASFSTGRTLSLASPINVNTTGNAATVTTNANLTGPVTSTGNATAIANGAISNAMLANGAVTNLSGTNTGDETAARIATALNAGTADSTADDTDKLAVTHPAGGWMLLSTLWTWIEAKINALATITGAKSFTGQISSSGSTSVADTNNVVNVATNDARYGTPYNFKITTDWTAASLVSRNSTESIVLPIGTYEFEGCIYADTTSVTAGINANFVPSNISADTTQAIMITGGSSGLNGTSDTSADIIPRVGSNQFLYAAAVYRDGGASGKACFGFFRGFVTFSAVQTIQIQVSHRTTTAATATVAATRYTILSVGTTNFTSIGAASNTVGLLFTASGAGTGTGTVTAATVGSSIAVTSAVAGRSYVIDSIGTTDFTLIGASANTANLSFTATGAGTGTGMISEITSAAVAKAGSFINFTKR